MTCYLQSIATSVPENSLPQQQTYEIADSVCDAGSRSRAAEAVYRKTGVGHRGSVLFAEPGSEDAPQTFYPVEESPGTGARMAAYDRHARLLARQSATSAVGRGGVAPADFRHLITTSCTGFASPGWELGLYGDVGLSPGCHRTQVGFMGCHAAFNALRAARSLVQTDGPALVCCTELCSLHMHYGWDSDKVVANALFADGSASVVCTDQPDRAFAEILDSATHVEPGTESQMSWTIGDHGFEMTLSPEVADVIRQRLPDWIDGRLASVGLKRSDVAAWACHPGGPRILGAVEGSLDLGDDGLAASRGILHDRGNMSSPTILFILERMKEAAVQGPVVALGFGPGLTFESMILDFK